MYKFRVLHQFSHYEKLYNVRRETYELNDPIVLEWEKMGLVTIVEDKAEIKLKKK